MRYAMLAILALAAATAAAGYMQRIPVDVSDSRRDFPLRVARGETLDVAFELFDAGAPLDIGGCAATLHTRTNGMPVAESWQTHGQTSGRTALFRLDVDAVLPAQSGTWSLVVSNAEGVLTRVGGSAYVRGTAAASGAAIPVDILSAYTTTGQVAAATNSILVLADSHIAAATNAIPQPDMGAYLRKDGGRMKGDLTVSDDFGTDCDVSLNSGYGNVTARTRKNDPSRLWMANYNGDSIEVMDGESGMDYRILYFPSRSGTLAVESASPYADPAPWSPSYALAPSETATDTYVVTNGDIAATYTRDVVYQDALLDITIQDRPEPYTYTAPTGTWDIVEDAAGAAASIVPDGARARLVSSRTASGTVTARYSTPSNGEQTVSIWLSQTSGRPVKVGDDYDLPGTPRHAWQTNLLARLAVIDYSARHEYAHCYGGEAYGPEYIADALSPFNDLGDTLAVPTGPNAGFFWPELAANILPRSVVREDIAPGKPWHNSPVLFISPHWAVQAGHWNYAPPVTICTNYAAGAFVRLTASTRRAKGGGVDLALVRYRTAVPPQCIAKLVTEDVLREVSPSLFDKACGIHFSQHGTVHPFAVGGASAGGSDWTATGYDAATNACHLTHGGDSGQPIALVAPSAKIVWLACHYTAYGGPMLYDPENLAWIEAQLATDNEAPTYWTAEELMEE